ncbi:MAG TPA: holo-ACP synthase [Gemmatimonadaceae bacterium]
MIIGIGVDVVEISRVRSMIASQGERALARLFTPAERSYCADMANPARHFAVRVAAKEATFKALSGSDEARGIGWREMEVELDAIGRPSIRLHGRASARARELGVAHTWISLSHGDDLATAFVVLESVP